MAEATQEHRAIAVETPLGPDALLLRTMSGTETVSRLFEYELELLSEDPEIDGNDLLGENLSVRMMQLSGDTRYFNGYVSAFRSVPGSAKFSRYQISMRPWLWFLTRISDCRIFQETTIPDVVKQVFQDRGFSDYKFNLSGTYPTRAYIVQFRETDFNFISRLLEFEGVYYYFEHENGKHTMVLCDSYSAHEQGVPYEVEYFPPDEGVVRECLHSWSVSKSLQPTSYLLDAFNFESPTTSLRARRSVQRAHANGELEVYDPEDTYLQASDGDGYAQKRIEELASQFETVAGEGNVRGLAAGYLFKLTEFPVETQQREYLLLSISHRIESDAFGSGGGASGPQYACAIEAIDATEQYRPPRITPKPEISGPQTAIVTGPSGEEIHTDRFGRVKVQFHWDHYGQADADSSCWIRVSQEWAGKNWGSIHLPRIGQEVIVDFIDGDPDRPIITGRLYNGDNMPPYTLPDEQTKSGIKSNSSKTGGGFNEFRFEDEKGEERVFLHGEKDLDIRVKHTRSENIGDNRRLIVGQNRYEQIGNDMHTLIENDHFEQVNNEQHLTYGSDRFMEVSSNNNRTVGADENIDVGGDLNLKMGGNHNQEVGQKHSLDAGMDIHEKAGMNIASEAGMNVHIKGGINVVVEAGVSLTLKVGGNFVNISPAGVAIQGTMVMINSGGAAGSGSGSSPTAAAAAEAPTAPEAPNDAIESEPGSVAAAKAASPEQLKRATTSSTAVREFSDPQAQVLAAAAESGTPFCEECERARQQQGGGA